MHCEEMPLRVEKQLGIQLRERLTKKPTFEQTLSYRVQDQQQQIGESLCRGVEQRKEMQCQ